MGRDTNTLRPSLKIWCSRREPPRPRSSRNTPIWYPLRSAGSPQRLYWRRNSGATTTSRWAPASKGGSGLPSAEPELVLAHVGRVIASTLASSRRKHRRISFRGWTVPVREVLPLRRRPGAAGTPRARSVFRRPGCLPPGPSGRGRGRAAVRDSRDRPPGSGPRISGPDRSAIRRCAAPWAEGR